MDKYQKVVFNRIKFKLINNDGNGSVSIDNNKIQFIQNENYTIEKYNFIIISEVVESVIVKGEKEVKFNCENNQIEIPIDFCNQYKEIEFVFSNDIVDNLKLPTLYVGANKEEFDKKNNDIKRQELITKMRISSSCGDSLVNIKFQPANENVVKTKIELYDANKQLMAKYNIEEDLFFKSIDGLAYGKYYYVVEQFDKDNKSVVKSDYLEFELTIPSYGRNTVCPHR